MSETMEPLSQAVCLQVSLGNTGAFSFPLCPLCEPSSSQSSLLLPMTLSPPPRLLCVCLHLTPSLSYMPTYPFLLLVTLLSSLLTMKPLLLFRMTASLFLSILSNVPSHFCCWHCCWLSLLCLPSPLFGQFTLLPSHPHPPYPTPLACFLSHPLLLPLALCPIQPLENIF